MMLMLVHTFQQLDKQIKLIVELEPIKMPQDRILVTMPMQVTMLTKQVNPVNQHVSQEPISQTQARMVATMLMQVTM